MYALCPAPRRGSQLLCHRLGHAHGEPGPACFPSSGLKAGHTSSWASGHFRGGSLGPASFWANLHPRWTDVEYTDVSTRKGHSATLIFTVCLENAPKSKGIEATTISKGTAHNPGGPGAASESECWARGPGTWGRCRVWEAGQRSLRPSL